MNSHRHILFILISLFCWTSAQTQSFGDEYIVMVTDQWSSLEQKSVLGISPIMQLSNPYAGESEHQENLRYEAILLVPEDGGENQFDYDLNCEVEIRGDGTLLGSKNLMIENGSAKFVYKDMLSVPAGYFDQLTLDIVSFSSSTPLPDNIQLQFRIRNQSEILIESPMTINLAVTENYSKTSSNGEVNGLSRLMLKWDAVQGAQFYEVYYAYEDAHDMSNDGPSLHDWIVVRTNNTHYSIDATYPKGTLHMQVRASGRAADANGVVYDHINVVTSNITSVNFGSSTSIPPFEANEHWQMQQSFAEEGKSKKVLQFFDNTLRSRQTITYLNDEEAALVAETDYDLEGRPTIQILPTPVDGDENNLFFKPGFNLNGSGQPYSYLDHEQSVAAALNLQAGAGEYYSDNNTQQILHRDYIPDAEGFPLTQMKYMRDNTGRVRKQSGVGAQYKLEEGHDTRYYYTTPSEDDLRLIFGDVIGKAKHYKKNFVVDPNGQASVSYLDKYGNVVATALAGPTPDNVTELDGISTISSTEALDIDEREGPNRVRSLIYPFFSDQTNQTITFEYSFVPGSFAIPDVAMPHCYTSGWRLNIFILDEDGVEVPIVVNGANFDNYTDAKASSISQTSNCLPPQYSYTITSNIDFGEYTIYKHLTPIEEDVQYLENVLAADLVNEVQLASDILAELDVETCYQSCEQRCEDMYGAMGMEVDFEMCMQGCRDEMEIVASEAFSLRCDGVVASLANQLAPNDENQTDATTFIDGANGITDCLAMKSSDATTPTFLPITSADGQNLVWNQTALKLGTLDENGVFVELSITAIDLAGRDGTVMNFDLSSNLVDALTSSVYWQPQWGDHLVDCHQGYCHVILCEALLPSDEFDYEINAQASLEDAYAHFVGGTPSGALVTDLESLYVALRAQDPFLIDASINDAFGPSTDIFTIFNNALDQFVCDLDGGQQICAEIDPGGCSECSIADFVEKIGSSFDMDNHGIDEDFDPWVTFSAIYTGTKAKVLVDIKKDECPLDLAPGVFPDDEFLLINTVEDLRDYVYSRVDEVNNCQIKSDYWIQTFEEDYLSAPIADPSTFMSLLEDYCDDQCGLLKSGPTWDAQPLNVGGTPLCPGSDVTFPLFENNNLSPDKWGYLELNTGPSPAPPMGSCATGTGSNIYDAWIGFEKSGTQQGIDLKIGVLQNGLNQEFIQDLAMAVYYRPDCATGLTVLDCDFEMNANGDLHHIMDISDNGYYFYHIFSNGSYSSNPRVFISLNNAANAALPEHISHEFSEIEALDNHILANYSSVTTAQRHEFIDRVWSCTESCGVQDEAVSCALEAAFDPAGYVNTSNVQACTTEYSSVKTGGVNDCYKKIVAFTYIRSCDNRWFSEFQITTKLDFVYIVRLVTGDGMYLSLHDDSEVMMDYKLLGQHYNNEMKDLFIPLFGVDQYLPLDLNILHSDGSDKRFITASPVVVQKSPSISFSYEDCATGTSAEDYHALCVQALTELADELANEIATEERMEYVNSWLKDMREAGVDESADLTRTKREYHYTIYYRDLLGNVLSTVSPKGVNANNSGNHNEFLKTDYTFNSFNIPLLEDSDDHGITRYYYDSKLRLRLTEDEQRRLEDAYIYTKYDDAERIIETGEFNSTASFDRFMLDAQVFPDDLPNMTDRVITTYDVATADQAAFPQDQLQGRVSSVTREGQATTHYDYDVHGNVEGMRQEIDVLDPFHIYYDYDLISGNVHEVSYNPGYNDQYFHRYSYDADNRLDCAFSSTDRLTWDEDARYFYYRHGPLARIELGENKVQGCDNFYTLQGWIKGMNMPTGAATYQLDDLGSDGANSASQIDNINQHIARDAFAYILGYNDQDYLGIGLTQGQLPSAAMATMFGTQNSDLHIENEGLYNGNIVASVYDNPAITNTFGRLHGHSYRYDQLHRLRRDNSAGFDGSGWSIGGNQNGNAFKSSYTYDANGNLLELNRRRVYGGNGQQFDALQYRYNVNKNKPNQLRRVDDPRGSGLVGFDIDDQGGNNDDNYLYDKIGQLTIDHSNTTAIEWDPYAKIESVTNTNTGVTATYGYDGMGNRVFKRTVTNGTTTTDYYVRDAQGNVLSFYSLDGATTELTQSNVVLYGSSRLGSHDRDLVAGSLADLQDFAYSRNDKGYELSNHLGNVHAVVADRKEYDATADQFDPVYRSYTDYYAFGFEIAGRSMSSDEDNSFGFNGKLRDDNLGNITNYDYGFRIYNPGIARFLSVDPLKGSYPWYTPYQFAGNSPILHIDLDGLESLPWYLNENNHGGKPVLTLGLGELPLASRGTYVPGYPIHNAGTFIENSLVSAYNDFATTWNQAREGKTGTMMLVEADRAIGEFTKDATYEDYKQLAANVKTYETLTGGLLTAYATKKVNNDLFNVGSIVSQRKALAQSWMKYDSYMQYVDFDKPVYTKHLEKGDELVQFRVKGSEGTIGNFYAPKGTTPSQIGLDPDDVTQTLLVTVEKKTKALFSTHKKKAPYYADESVTTKGGGTQIFSRELKQNVSTLNTPPNQP